MAQAPEQVPAAAQVPVQAPAPAKVEEIEEVTDVKVVDPTLDPLRYPIIDRAVNLMTARTTRPRALVIVVDHRTHKAFTDDIWHNYFGLDGGNLRIGLGVRFGIIDGLDVGVYRLNDAGLDRYDLYEFDVKCRPLYQERFQIDLAIRAGLAWYSQKDADDAVRVFLQLLVSRTFWNRLTVGAGFLFHPDSGGENKSNLDTEYSMAVPFLAEVRILPWLAWNVELAVNVAGYGEAYPAWASSVKFITNRHTFALVLSNTQYIGADGIVANSWRGFHNLIVGFAITREVQF